MSQIGLTKAWLQIYHVEMMFQIMLCQIKGTNQYQQLFSNYLNIELKCKKWLTKMHVGVAGSEATPQHLD